MAEYVVRLLRSTPKQALFVDSDVKRQMIKAGRRGGKAQPLTSKIYTPNGFTLMGNIKIGDQVLTPSGTIAFVEDIFPQGVVDIYKVTFNDGTFAECTQDHLWEVHQHDACCKWKYRTKILTTNEIKRKLKLNMSSGRPKIAFTDPVRFNAQEIPLDPYALGLLIGDGTMTQTGVAFSTTDSYLLDELQKRLPASVKVIQDGKSIDYRLSKQNKGLRNELISILRDLNLFGKYSYEKHIPDIYKYNSIDVRMSLIQGFLDSDGWVDDRGQAWLQQTSKQLAEDFAEVIQSLGGTCSTKVSQGGYQVNGERKECRLVYNQYIYYPDASSLFTLPRKKALARPRARKLWRYIKNIEFIREEAAQCIKISDPKGLYLTNHFIVTHNTVGVGIRAVKRFLKRRRILYAAPTTEQIARFWYTVCTALRDPIERGALYKNESEHIIEVPGTENRIRAKTAWNADTLRGDYADDLILDEYQLMNEDAWQLVGAPMMLDTNGSASFIYTPPSLRSRSVTKANDPQHAAKMFKRYQELAKVKPDRYATYHFTSMDNPYLSQEALADISSDMTSIGYRMEILAEDVDQAPGALWTRELIEKYRIHSRPVELDRIVVAIDPSTTSDGDEAGIIGMGKLGDYGYLLADESIQGSPLTWANAAIKLYHALKADCIVAEANQGGEMISTIICGIDKTIKVSLVHASRGKAPRAEPVAAKYEAGYIYHVGDYAKLEDEMCLWEPGQKSPNRMDALVWAATELKLEGVGTVDWLKVIGE